MDSLDQQFLVGLEAVLRAAHRWGKLDLGPDEVSVLTNWHFDQNCVSGTPGIIETRRATPQMPPPFALIGCTLSRSDYLPLADLLIDLINDAVAQRTP
jgi:hypothetical protein